VIHHVQVWDGAGTCIKNGGGLGATLGASLRTCGLAVSTFTHAKSKLESSTRRPSRQGVWSEMNQVIFNTMGGLYGVEYMMTFAD